MFVNSLGFACLVSEIANVEVHRKGINNFFKMAAIET